MQTKPHFPRKLTMNVMCKTEGHAVSVDITSRSIFIPFYIVVCESVYQK